MTRPSESFYHLDVPLATRLRFCEYVMQVRGADDECWIWPLSVGSHGYGQIGWGGRDGRGLVLAHRLSYAMWRGVIPVHMTIDHECRNRRCVNPYHLRLMTNVANARLNGNAIKTHCPRGHPYDEENTYIRANGWRICRRCGRERQRANYAAQ